MFLIPLSAEATHFRYGHVTWTRVPGTNTVTFTVTTAWRDDFIGVTNLNTGNFASFNELSSGDEIASGPGYSVRRFTGTHTYPNEGPWLAWFQSGDRISSVVNSHNTLFRVESVVDLRNGNTGSPVSTIPVILQMEREALNEIPIPVTDPDNDPISFRLATQAESHIQFIAGSQCEFPPLDVTPDGVLTWETRETVVGELYAVQVVMEENHAGNVSKVALDFIIEIVEYAANQPPDCEFTWLPAGAEINGRHVTLSASPGETITVEITGTDPEGGALEVIHNGLPDGATITPVIHSTGSSPMAVTFEWTPGPETLGTAHAVNMIFLDDAGLQGVCSFAIRVPLGTAPVAVASDGLVVDLDENGLGTLDVSAVDGGSYDPDGTTVTLSLSPPFFTCDDLGMTPLTLAAVDPVGLRGTDETLVLVRDLLPPTIQCPADLNVVATGPGGANADPGTAEAADNCGTVSVEGVRSDALPLGDPYPAGVTSITWTATDGSGNTVQCVQTVNVAPAPTATASATATPSATSTPSATGTSTPTPSSTPSPLATATPSASSTATATPSPTGTPTPSPSADASATASATSSATPHPTGTPFPGATATGSATPAPSAAPTGTPSATPAGDCPSCEGAEVIVDGMIDIDAANLAATAGVLAPFATFDGENIIINLGSRPLRVTSNGRIRVPGGENLQPAQYHVSGNHGTPNLRIVSGCVLLIEPSTRGNENNMFRNLTGVIETNAHGRRAGDIELLFDAGILIQGGVQSVQEKMPDAQIAISGSITLASVCGNVEIAPTAWVFTWGENPGTGSINLLQCGEGDIVVEGLVMNRTNHTIGDNDPPIINVSAVGGGVLIDGGNFVLNEWNLMGAKFDMTSGLIAIARVNDDTGRINVEASGDIVIRRDVSGHSLNRTNFAAVATHVNSSSPLGGEIRVRSTGGSVYARDRAFQAEGRNNNSTALISIEAAGDIVVQSPTIPTDEDHSPTITCEASPVNGNALGGTNRLRSCGGDVVIAAGAEVTAWGVSAPGQNLLTAASGGVFVAAGALVSPGWIAEGGCPAPPQIEIGCGAIGGTPGPTPTPGATATPGATGTPGATPTPGATGYPTATPQGTSAPTATAGPTSAPSPAPTLTPAPSATADPTPAATPTAEPSASPAASPTAAATASPAASPTAAASGTPSATPTPTTTAAPTTTAGPTGNPTATPAATATPAGTATPAASVTPTPTASPAASATPTVTATPSPSSTVSPAPSPTPSQTATPTVTSTPTPVPPPNVSPVAGLPGPTLKFNPVLDAVHQSRPTQPDVITLEAWVKPELDASMNILSFGNYDDRPAFRIMTEVRQQFRINPDGYFEFRLLSYFYGMQTITSTVQAEAGKWYHLAGAGGAGCPMRFYVNGVDDGQRKSIIELQSPSANNYAFGPRGQGYLDFVGELDEVRLWSGRLYPEEVRARMFTRLAGDEPGLAAYWPIEQGEGDIVFDHTIDHNCGIFDAIAPDWVAPWSDSPNLNTDGVVHTEKGTDVTFPLAGADYNGDPLSLRITGLPASGTLYQTLDGVTAGDPIQLVGTVVLNPEGLVIYSPGPGDGEPFDQFHFVASDGQLDSLPARVNIHITPNNPPIAGLHGRALEFDGSGDRVRIPDPFDPSAFTMEAWVRFDDTNLPGAAGRLRGTPATFHFGLDADERFWFHMEGQQQFGVGETHFFHSAIPGQWYHIAATAEAGGRGRLFVNGLEEGIRFGVGTLPVDGFEWSLGTEFSPNSSRFLDGALDEVRFWDHVRTPDQIRADMYRKLDGGEPGLLGHFPLEAGDGPLAYNGARHYHGLLLGETQWSDSDAPVLTEISTVRTERETDAAIALRAVDADGDPTTIRISVFPSNGTLYKTSDGVTRGDVITPGDPSVDSPGNRVIYAPGPGAGLPFDSFAFVADDGEDDSLAATVAIDIQPNRAPIAGLRERATDFDGIDDLIHIPDPEIHYEYTLEAWIRPRKVTGGGVIARSMEVIDVDARRTFQIRLGPDALLHNHLWGPFGGPTVDHVSLVPFQPGQWVHVAGTGVANGPVRIFINGFEQTTPDAVAQIRDFDDGFQIGANSGSGYFDGEIDEVRVWDHARTPGQIQALMHQDLAGDEPGLLGYWGMDEDAGDVVLDATTRMIHGAFVSEPFRTDSTAPLVDPDARVTARPGRDRLIRLGHFDADGDSAGFTITQLPANGIIYQTADGVTRGAAIVSPVDPVSDPFGRVIYAPGPGTGTDFDEFLFRADDGTDVSPDARVIIDVPANHPPVAGLSGFAVEFNGHPDEIVIDDAFDPTEFTIEAWVNSDTVIGFRNIVAREAGAIESRLYIENNPDKFAAQVRGEDNSLHTLRSLHPVTPGRWYHAAASAASDGTLRLFIDGRELTGPATHNGVSDDGLRYVIGGTVSGANALSFQGVLDDVRIWSVPRTPEQIRDNMHSNLTGAEPGLLGYWAMDDGTGFTAADGSPRGNDGLFLGSPMWVPSGAPVYDPAASRETLIAQPITLDLQGADLDGDPLTARITIPPVAGTLHQTSDGVTPGDPINIPGTLVTDPLMRVIYVSGFPSAGDVVGFVVNDTFTDSPEATVTVSVLAPPTATSTPTPSPSPYPTPTPSPLATPTPTASITATPTPSHTASPTPTVSPTVTASPTPEPNLPPVITSFAPRSLLVDTTFVYDAEADDPNNDPLLWTLTTAPPGMTIDPVTGLVEWFADDEGRFQVTIHVDDMRGGTDTQAFTVLVSKTGNSAPQIVSSPETVAFAGLPYQYNVEAEDADGFPIFHYLIESPEGMTIQIGSGEIDWTPTAADIGAHTVSIRVEDPHGASDAQSFTLDVLDPGDITPPTVDLTADTLTPDPGQTVNLTVTVADDVELATVQLLIGGFPVTLSGAPPVLTATFSSPTAGVFLAEATATDTSGNSAADAEIILVQDPADNDGPFVEILSPATDTEVTEPTDVIGTVTDDNLWFHVLEYRRTRENAPWTEFARGESVVVGGTLGLFDPTLMINGVYDVRLTATDLAGRSASETIRLRVAGDMKIGHFSITIEDLAIPVSGIPVTVNRTYDTRNKSVGDFGFGWTLDFQDVRLQENVIPGDNWDLSTSGFFICGNPDGEHYINITLPDGREEEFDVVLEDSCVIDQGGSGVNTVKLVARPGTFSTLESLTDNVVIMTGFELTTFAGTTWNPNRYRLTTRDGYEFIITQPSGGGAGRSAIESVTDPNGNSITFDEDGVIHSTGKSITFTRDALGRITHVTDPLGGVITYEYDANGDLVKVTDQEGRTTRYTYAAGHYLADIIDGRGVRVSRNVYDDAGRLIETIDANGNSITIGHDIAGRTEIITDREGAPTVMTYDARGRVVREIAANGAETRREYGARRTMTKETVAFGTPIEHTVEYEYNGTDDMTRRFETVRIPQPGGGETTQFIEELWTYDAKGNQTQHTDPRGFVTDMVYDAKNNMTLETRRGDPGTADDDIVTSHTFDSNGHRTETQDAEGNLTRNTYNFLGHMTQTRVILGQDDTTSGETDDIVTTMAYDANGRPTSVVGSCDCSGERLTEYDSSGLPIRETELGDPLDPLDDEITETIYDPAGNPSLMIDAKGFFTETVYEPSGRMIAHRQPAVADPEAGGALTSPTRIFSHDREGRIISISDFGGETTRTIRDEHGQEIARINADGSRLETENNLRSMVVRIFDERSVAAGRAWFTEYIYDSKDRNVVTVDAPGNETRMEHDEAGNVVATVDALGRRTETVYDEFGRMTETVLPPATPGGPNVYRRTEYDKLGRKVRETDENDHETLFGYDEAGRMTSVTDARGSTWTFGFDEDGHMISQTDPLTRVTNWEYDDHGRKKVRVLPLGQTESFAYDKNGNMVLHEKFDGSSITYAYDALNREIFRDYPNDPDETREYSLSGDLVRATGEHGQTVYSYDINRRRSRVDHPTNESLLYNYDEAGNLRETKIQNTSTSALIEATENTYDMVNRIDTVTSSIGTWAYEYNEVGMRAAVINPNGTRTDYEWDGRNRLTRLTTENTLTSVPINDFQYELDDKGNRLAVTDHADGSRFDYAYDEVDRLVSEIRTGAADAYSRAITLDAVGNRLTQVTTGHLTDDAMYLYDANDRLISVVDGPRTILYSYDANGNQSEIAEASSGLLLSYVWNDRDRLAIALENGLPIVSYMYDHVPNRIARDTHGVVTRYLVDEGADNRTGFAQALRERDIHGVEVARFTYGAELLGQIRADIQPTGDSISFYHADGAGSIRTITDTSGSVAHAYTFEAFGTLLAESSLGISPNNHHLFAGEFRDPDTGLYYLRARYLDSAVGRLLSMDEEFGFQDRPQSLHDYIYAGGNPLGFIDPSGNGYIISTNLGTAHAQKLSALKARAVKCLGNTVKNHLVMEIKDGVINHAIEYGVYIFLEQIAPGVIIPYVGKGNIADRIGKHVRAERIYNKMFVLIDLKDPGKAKIAEQKLINLFSGYVEGLPSGYRNKHALLKSVSNTINALSPSSKDFPFKGCK